MTATSQITARTSKNPGGHRVERTHCARMTKFKKTKGVMKQGVGGARSIKYVAPEVTQLSQAN